MKLLRKILGSSLLLAFISSICFATIPNSEFALGGLKKYMTPDEVHQIYGPPLSSAVKPDPFGKYVMTDIYILENEQTLKVSYGNENGRWKISNFITDSRDVHTDKGIHVGMTTAELFKIYGAPDSSVYPKNRDKVTGIFWYRTIPLKDTKPGTPHNVMMIYTENGIVTSISCIYV